MATSHQVMLEGLPTSTRRFRLGADLIFLSAAVSAFFVYDFLAILAQADASWDQASTEVPTAASRKPVATKVIPQRLVLALKSLDANEKSSAAVEILERHDPCHSEALEVALAGLKSDNVFVRSGTIWLLCNLGRENPKAISILMEIASAGDRDLRLGAISAIRELGPTALRAVPLLIEKLDDPDYSVCLASARALGNMGPAGRQAMPALLRKLESTRGFCAIQAAVALIRIDPLNRQAVAFLRRSLVTIRKPLPRHCVCSS